MSKPTIGMILYLNPDYYPPTVNAVYLLAEHFNVILIGRNYDLPNVEYPPNVTVHRLGPYSSICDRMNASPWHKLWEYLNFIYKAKQLLKGVALIYAYDAYGYTAAFVGQRFALQSVPLVYQNHEIESQLPSLFSLAGWVQRAERAWIDRAQLVVFPDRERASFFQRITGLPTAPEIVPNFPRKAYFSLPTDWSAIIRQRWDDIRLFYRGSISETSAMREIVFAGHLLRTHYPSLQVQFVGFLIERDAQDLDLWIESIGMRDAFSYLGVLPYRDLQTPTQTATIGFALYKNTSFDRVACASACNKIYEYAACGLPVIVSDFPTYRDYLAAEPWVRFADPQQPQSIANAVEDILRDYEEYRALCLAARQAFEQKFNYETVFSPLLSNLKTLVNAHA